MRLRYYLMAIVALLLLGKVLQIISIWLIRGALLGK